MKFDEKFILNTNKGYSSMQQLRMTAYASLFAALTAVGAYLAIPIGPVPIVLQNLFVFLTGLLLGSKWGATSMAAYLLAGICGLPVFAGGRGGIGHIIGPTGGYLIGFLPAVYFIGIIKEKAKANILFDVLALVIATAIIYLFGIVWLKTITQMTLSKTLLVGMVPFLPGDAIKVAVAVVIAKKIRPLIQNTSYAIKI
jgi:biotin transport system substrate-specific component